MAIICKVSGCKKMTSGKNTVCQMHKSGKSKSAASKGGTKVLKSPLVRNGAMISKEDKKENEKDEK